MENKKKNLKKAHFLPPFPGSYSSNLAALHPLLPNWCRVMDHGAGASL